MLKKKASEGDLCRVVLIINRGTTKRHMPA